MTLTKLKLILNTSLKDHEITLDWIIRTDRPIQEKEALENRMEVLKNTIALIDS